MNNEKTTHNIYLLKRFQSTLSAPRILWVIRAKAKAHIYELNLIQWLSVRHFSPSVCFFFYLWISIWYLDMWAARTLKTGPRAAELNCLSLATSLILLEGLNNCSWASRWTFHQSQPAWFVIVVETHCCDCFSTFCLSIRFPWVSESERPIIKVQRTKLSIGNTSFSASITGNGKRIENELNEWLIVFGDQARARATFQLIFFILLVRCFFFLQLWLFVQQKSWPRSAAKLCDSQTREPIRQTVQLPDWLCERASAGCCVVYFVIPFNLRGRVFIAIYFLFFLGEAKWNFSLSDKARKLPSEQQERSLAINHN